MKQIWCNKLISLALFILLSIHFHYFFQILEVLWYERANNEKELAFSFLAFNLANILYVMHDYE